MSGNLKKALGLGAASAFLWAFGLGLMPFYTDICVPAIVLAVASGMCAVGMCAVAAAEKSREGGSAYKTFAMAVALVAAAAAAFAFYDMSTSSGFLAGLLGTLILIFFEPVAFVLLIIDYICWRNRK